MVDIDLRRVDLDRLYCNAAVVSAGVVERFDSKGVIDWDIETEPRPADELAEVMVSFPEMVPFDEAGVKLGRMTDEKKIAAKIAESREKHVTDYLAKKQKYEREFVEKAALDPMRGRVLAIGYGDKDGQRVIHAGDEADLLTELWSLYYAVARDGGRLVGWNTHKFDLPFCRQRSFFHGLPVPEEMLVRGRYYADCLVDLMLVWQGGTPGFTGIDPVARFLGCGGKNGEGAEFARLWHEDRDQAIRYLVNDIDMCVAIGSRLGY